MFPPPEPEVSVPDGRWGMRVTCSVNRLWVCLFSCWGWRGGEDSSLLLSRCHRPLGAWPRLVPPVIQDLSFKLCQSSTSFPGLSHTQEHLCYESPPVMLSGLEFSSPMLVPALHHLLLGVMQGLVLLWASMSSATIGGGMLGSVGESSRIQSLESD